MKSMEEEAIFSTQTIVEQSAKSIKVLLEDVDGLAMLMSTDVEIADNVKQMNQTEDRRSGKSFKFYSAPN